MSGFSTASNDHLIRSNLWSTDIKEVFLDELQAEKYVKMVQDFPDGDTLNIPSIGQAESLDYVEGQAVRYSAMDTGNFTFTIDQYKSSATYITNKMKQDSYVMSELVASFVPRQSRALAKAREVKILAVGPDGQTASNANTINGAAHRWVASGTNETIDVIDFAKAKYALQKANVPMNNLIAIVDPSVEYKLATLTNLINLSNNKAWEGIVKTGISTGMRFITNIYGFDVYTSQNLKQVGAETVTGLTVAQGAANLFFSADSTASPFIGHIRQMPKVDSEYNKDMQRDEYVTTCRYGYALFRPEAVCVVLSDTDQV